MSNDRTELYDLAMQEPERLAKMIADWQKTAAEVLQAPGRFREPVAEAVTKHFNTEWSDHSIGPTVPNKHKKKKSQKKK